MTNLLMNAFTYISEVFIIYIYAVGIFEKRFNLSKMLVVGLSIFVVPFILNQFWNNPVINISSFFIATTAFLGVTYKMSLKHCALQGLILTAVMFATEMVASYTVSLALGEDSFYAYRDNEVVFILNSIISKVFFLIGCKLCNYFKLRNNKLYSTPISYFVFCFTVILAMLVLIMVNIEFSFGNYLQMLIVIVSVLLVSSLVILFIDHERQAVKNAELLELRSEQQKQQIDTQYLQIIEQNNKNSAILVHDMKNHLQHITSLADTQEVRSYVESIFQEVQSYGYIGMSKNKTLDLLISKYLNLCQGKGIKIDFDVKTANLSSVSPTDVSTIINNLLDNAVESAEQSKAKTISVSIFKKQGFEILKIQNSCDTKPQTKNGNLLTTKKEKQLHGYGTQSVIKTINKYDGMFDWEYSEGEKIFTATVALPI